LEQQQQDLLNSWRYFERIGCTHLASLLRNFLCVIFHICEEDNSFFSRDFTCSELESLISQDQTITCGQEIEILKVVIDWARCKSDQAGELREGDEVRVKQECKLEEWRGADCIVKKIVLNSLVQVELLEQTGKGSAAVVNNVELESEDVYDAASTGMMRLLPHVRCAFITPQQLRTQLSNDDIFFESKFDCYRDMVKCVAEVTVGKCNGSNLGERGKPRVDEHLSRVVMLPWGTLLRL
jgi:hypothetical protein